MLNVCVILDGLKSRVPSVENDSRVFFYLPLCVREKKLFGNVKKTLSISLNKIQSFQTLVFIKRYNDFYVIS